MIVATEKDLPSNNIGKKLLELSDFKEYSETPFKTYKKGEDLIVWHKEDLIFATDMDNYYDAEAYIFIFRHKSKNNEPILTIHSCGNPTSKPMREGNPFELAYTDSALMLTILKNLEKRVPEGFKVMYEATHHSPTNLSKPVMFVEIGSVDEHYNNLKAIEAVAESILAFLENPKTECKSCIGFGGGHYADRFTRRAIDENMAFGHIIPSYTFNDTNAKVIKQAIEKTKDCKYVVIDTRNQGKQEEREPLIKAMEELGMEIIKLK